MKKPIAVRCWLQARALLVAIASLLPASPVYAQGLDQLYERTQTEKTWGERLADSFGFGDSSKSYALVIGISDYNGGYSDLPTANDARRMADFLFEEAGFDHVRLLTEDKATRDRISELMSETFPTLLDADDRFLFYWSGHGDTRAVAVGGGKAGYLPLADTPPERWSRMIAMEDVQRWNRFLPARQSLFLLDACFGGLAGVVPQSSSSRDLRIEQLAQPGHHVMSAGTENEQTIASDHWGGSLFTRALIDGLRGDADAATDFERDGIISLTELKSYVQNRVLHERELAGWIYQITPQVRDLRVNSGEFFFLAKHAPRSVQSDIGSGGASTQAMGGETTGTDAGGTDIAQAPVLGQEPEISQMSLPEVLSTFRDCEQCPEMVSVPAGVFYMGSPENEDGRDYDEGPLRRVEVAPFSIGKYEVTFSEWDACVEAGGCSYRPDDNWWGREHRPVINVSWEDIKEYLAWLASITSKDYRLPSEAEWEHAARAGTTTRYAYGDTISIREANYEKAIAKTVEVGSYPPNQFGLHDVHGNVWEWVEDRWHETYENAPFHSIAWIDGNENRRVIRGGSWSAIARVTRSASRYGREPAYRSTNGGFRVARSVSP